jgi:hypothetical protein
MSNDILLEEGKQYTISDLEQFGLKKYKEFSSGTIIFKSDYESYWFRSNVDFINNTNGYVFLTKT